LRLPTPKQWSRSPQPSLREQPSREPTPTPPDAIPKTTAISNKWTRSPPPHLRPTRSLLQPIPPSKQPHKLLQLQPSPSHNNSPSKVHQTGETSPLTSAASTPFAPSHTTSTGSNNLNRRQYTYKQEPRVQSQNPPRSTKQHPDSYKRSKLNEQPPSISPRLQRISEINGVQKTKTIQGRNVKADVKVIKPRRGQSTRLRKAIFIPSTLTVATLAKLMNTKLGGYLYFRPETLLLTISIRIPSNEDAAGRDGRGS
jgi:hypothetical protein